jgi:hypothetical protein
VKVSRVTLEEAVERVARARQSAPESIGDGGGEVSPDALQSIN